MSSPRLAWRRRCAGCWRCDVVGHGAPVSRRALDTGSPAGLRRTRSGAEVRPGAIEQTGPERVCRPLAEGLFATTPDGLPYIGTDRPHAYSGSTSSRTGYNAARSRVIRSACSRSADDVRLPRGANAGVGIHGICLRSATPAYSSRTARPNGIVKARAAVAKAATTASVATSAIPGTAALQARASMP